MPRRAAGRHGRKPRGRWRAPRRRPRRLKASGSPPSGSDGCTAAWETCREARGIVTLVARDGKVVDVHATGFQDVESKTPMRENTIFRIASMSKPITSVAIMMLYEEGKLRLNDPVSRFIPAFKQQRVVNERAKPKTRGAA